MNKLNDRTARTAPGPGRLSDGGGLYLEIDVGGARRWLFRYRRAGREREAGFGGFPVVSLAAARSRRDEARQLLATGLDPIDAKRRADVDTAPGMTFGAFADQLLPELAKGFRNAKHAAQWTSTLASYAAALRSKPVASICTADVLDVLQPIWTSKSETASRVRGRIEKVLDAAKAKGLRTGDNPAAWKGNLDHLLGKRPRLTRGHHAALPYSEVPVFMATLRGRTAIAARGLEFLILTAGRTGEVIGARWPEIDRDAKIWTVPGERMKGGRVHRVPLTDRALVILDEVEQVRRGDYVFPSFRADRHLSNAAFDALLSRMKIAATPHGFRSSFRDWVGETTTFPREIAEAALAHVIGDETERAYRRGDALAKRRELMTAWADYLNTFPCEAPARQ